VSAELARTEGELGIMTRRARVGARRPLPARERVRRGENLRP
jgi:hypothetical protein